MRRAPRSKSRRPKTRAKPSTVALGIRNWRVPLYSHVSYLWTSPRELREAAGFLAAGFRADDHAVLVGSTAARRRITRLLAERGFNVRRLEAAGRITQLGGARSAEALLDAFEAAFEKATAAGAPRVRLLGVPGWGEQDWPDDASLLSLEARFSSVAQRYPSVTVCLYDARSLPKLILERGGFDAHSFVIAGGKLIDKTHPAAKEAFLASVTHAASSVAKRKRAEQALAESEARFANIFHVSPVALAISTIGKGRIIDANESWLQLFGYRRDEVLGRTGRDLGFGVDPQDRSGAVRRIRNEGVLRNLEIQVRRKSGEVRDLIVSAVPIDVGGGDAGWLSSHVDITDRKRAEAERDRLLESATAARGQAEAALGRLQAIQSITDSAVVHLTLDAMLQELLARLRRALQAEYAIVLLLDEERQVLYPRARDGPIHESIDLLRIPLGKGVSGRVAQTGQPLIVDDLSTVDLSGVEGVPPPAVLSLALSVMAAPLQVEGKVIGVVSVGSARRRRFTQEELELLLLVADRAAPAVERARLMETVKTAHDRLGALSQRLVQVQEAERAEVARELHDEVGQLLTGLHLMVAGDLEAEGRRGEIKSVVSEVMARVRDLSVSLRPPMLDALGLVPALLWQIERFEAQSRIQVAFHHANLDRRLPSEVETAAFRIVQEALTNVARHASVERVDVDVTAEATRLRARIEDRGRGFDVDAALGGPSSGLAGMRERARLLGGRLTIDSAAGAGTRLRLVLPLPHTEPRETKP